MPLVEVAALVGGQPSGASGDRRAPLGHGSRAVVVVTRGEQPVGLLVDGIVDIADEEPTDATQDGRRGPGVVGGAVVGGRLVELLDLEDAFVAAGAAFAGSHLEEVHA